SWEDLTARYHSELANGLGNLASRTLAMNAKYFGSVMPEAGEVAEADQAIIDLVARAAQDADAHMQHFRIHDAISSVWEIVDELNGYITDMEPWVLAKEDATRERLATVLATVTEGLRAL